MYLNGIVLTDDVYKLAIAGANIRLIELALPHVADVDHIERTVDASGHVQLVTVFKPNTKQGMLYDKAPLNPPVKPGHALTVFEPWRAANESSVVCGAKSVRVELKQSGAFANVNPLGEEGFARYWRENTDKDGWHHPFWMPPSAAQRSLLVMAIKPLALHELRADDLNNTACVMPASDRAVLVKPSMESLHATWEMGMGSRNAQMYGWDANPYVWVIDTEPSTIEIF